MGIYELLIVVAIIGLRLCEEAEFEKQMFNKQLKFNRNEKIKISTKAAFLQNRC